MSETQDRLRECVSCGRLFNTQVNHGKCPECGTKVSRTLSE